MNAIRALLQRPVAYQPIIAKATGSVKLTVLWCQIHYWTDKTQDPDGWVYKTRDAIFEETGLGRKEQETVRELGSKLGVLMSEVRGTPPTVHFRVDEGRMIELIERYGKENPEKQPPKRKSQKPESSMDWLKCIPDADLDEIAKKYNVARKTVIARAEDVRDYCEAKGKRYSDYKAALRNFIKSHIEKHPDAVMRHAATFTPSAEPPIERTEMTPEQRAASNKKLDEMRAELARKKAMK